MTTSTDTLWQNLAGLEEIAPMTKLDADQYSAEDLNGHTDTAAGTGSLNYALLQSAITRDAQAIAADGSAPYDIDSVVDERGAAASPGTHSNITADNADAAGAAVNARAGEDSVSGYSFSDAAIGHVQSQETGSIVRSPSSTNITNGNVFSLTASSGAAGHDGSNGQDGTNGNQATKIVGADGEDGNDGSDGQDGDGGTVTNTYNTYNGNTINNNYHSETTQSVSNNYYSTVDNHSSTTTINNSSSTVINNSVVNNTTNNTTSNTTTNDDHSVTVITINHGDHGGHHHHDHHDHNPSTDHGGTVHDHDLSIDFLGDDIGLILNPVENLLGDIDLGGGVNIDLLNTDHISNGTGDTDLVLGSGLEVISGPLGTILANIDLDTIEAVTGDIDINLTTALDGLGINAPALIDTLGGGTDNDLLLNEVADLVNDLTGLGAVPNGDHDLTVGLTGNAIALPVEAATDLILNPVEDVVGDIDIDLSPDLTVLTGAGSGPGSVDILGDIDIAGTDFLQADHTVSLGILQPLVGGNTDLTVAADLLGAVAAPVIDGVAGGTGGDTILAQLGNGLSDLGGAVFGDTAGNGDTDLLLHTGIGIVDQALISGTDSLHLNPVEDLIGDVDAVTNLDIDPLGSVNDTAGESDIHVFGDIGVDSQVVALPEIAISLDLVEQLVGDIDLSLDVSTNLLQPLADPVIDNHPGGSGSDSLINGLLAEVNGALDSVMSLVQSPASTTGILGNPLNTVSDHVSSWTEIALPQGADHLTDSVSGAIGSILPDPVSSVAHGLGGLVDLHHDTGHHHGLFG